VPPLPGGSAKEGCSCVTAKSEEDSLYYFYRDQLSMISSDIHMQEWMALSS